jgi:phage baseplate assembly protein W
MSISTNKREVVYRDLDLDFARHPFSGDVSQKVDMDAIRRSVRNLILTKRFDKPFHPEINSGIYECLFDPISPLYENKLKENVSYVLKTYEPRIKINNIIVVVSPDENYIFLSLSFTVIEIQKSSEVKIALQRTR